jgi:hypothetical protein
MQLNGEADNGNWTSLATGVRRGFPQPNLELRIPVSFIAHPQRPTTKFRAIRCATLLSVN